MESWYVEQPQPTFNSGFEQGEWDDYAVDGFDEILTETPLGDTVLFCKGSYDGETGLFETEVETQAVIQNRTPDAYTQGWKRQILARISDNIAEYKYIKVKDTLGNWQIYLIMTLPETNKIYTKAVIHECNYVLKWQDSKTGTIYYYPSYTADATQYNTGVENAGNVVQTGYIQLMSWVSLDEVTAELDRDKRMFIDVSKQHPETYIITSMSKVPYSYNEMRIMRITFTETEYNPDTDRIDLMLCDYVENVPQPTTPIEIKYSGEPQIRIGGRKTFKVESETPMTFSLIVAEVWRDKITMTQTNNQCVVRCVNDSAMVGANFRIEVAGGGQRSNLLVEVKGAV